MHNNLKDKTQIDNSTDKNKAMNESELSKHTPMMRGCIFFKNNNLNKTKQ
jgi:hypothetical protein